MLITLSTVLEDTDSKSIIDMPTVKPVKQVIKDFKKLAADLGIDLIKTNLKGDYTNEAQVLAKNVQVVQGLDDKQISVLKKFLGDNFLPVGSDIEPHRPEDWKEDLKLIGEVDGYLKSIVR